RDASAVEWPGWSRSERDEASALQALCDYGGRYASVMRLARLEFQPPGDVSAFNVIERVEGNATTDFGTPGMACVRDSEPVNDIQLDRFQALLKACWEAFDQARRAATGKELRKGPRGGGRDLEKIVEHVVGADGAYLKQLGFKVKLPEATNLEDGLARFRQAILESIATAVHGGVPELGPRGGKRWTARYFVRRSAWHVLDHTWEIEDRIGG
ncbi:MAG: hypothetical protein P8074_27490, partial [Anaerolineales bacterium]